MDVPEVAAFARALANACGVRVAAAEEANLTAAWLRRMQENAAKLETSAAAGLRAATSAATPLSMHDDAVRDAVVGFLAPIVPVTLASEVEVVALAKESSFFAGEALLIERSRVIGIRETWMKTLVAAGILDCVKHLDLVTPYTTDKFTRDSGATIEITRRNGGIADTCMKAARVLHGTTTLVDD